MNKYKKAMATGRLAMVPDWLFEGNTVFIWDSTDCDDEPCGDWGKLACPYRPGETITPVVIGCRRAHPKLRRVEVWSVAAYFMRSGVYFVINDYFQIHANDLPKVVFKNEREAWRNKPLVALL